MKVEVPDNAETFFDQLSIEVTPGVIRHFDLDDIKVIDVAGQSHAARTLLDTLMVVAKRVMEVPNESDQQTH